MLMFKWMIAVAILTSPEVRPWRSVTLPESSNDDVIEVLTIE